MPMTFFGPSGWGTSGPKQPQAGVFGGSIAEGNDLYGKGDLVWTDAGYVAAPGKSPAGISDGKGGMTGGGWGGGATGGFGTSFSFSGKDPFATDAAAAKLRDEFARMEQQQIGQIDEDAMASGVFSSGVNVTNKADARTRLKLGLGAGLESLFNNAAQQKMAFELEQQRMANEMAMAKQQQYANAGTYHYGNANDNQKMMQQGATYSSGDGQGSPSDFWGGTTVNFGGSGDDPRGKGSLELARAYYKATGKFGTPSDHAAWADDPTHPWNAGKKYVPAGSYMG